jgi:hypothetical protein
MPEAEVYRPLSGFGPNGPYMMYWAWKFCTPAGELAEKFPMAEVGTTGPAEVAREGMSGCVTGSMGKNVFAYAMALRLGQTRMQPTISTPFVPKWSIGKSDAENGVPSYQLEGADSYPKPLTDEKNPVAAEWLVKPTSRFGNCQITPFSTHRLLTEVLRTEGKVSANLELTAEVRFPGAV